MNKEIGKKRLVLSVALGAFLIILIVFGIYFRKSTYAAESINFDGDAVFKILEIIPNKAYAKIGYHIKDGEPIAPISQVQEDAFSGVLDALGGSNINCVVTQNAQYKNVYAWTNKDIFREKVLDGMPGKIQVLSVTPAEINANPALIDQANLISISLTVQNLAYEQLYKRYKDSSYNSGTSKKTYIGNDVSCQVTKKLYEYAIDKSKPFIIESLVYESFVNDLVKHDNNMYKLYLMIQLSSGGYFRKNCYDNIDFTSNSSICTYKGVTKWDRNLFYPNPPLKYPSDPEKSYMEMGIWNPRVTTPNNYVAGNLYSYTGEDIFDFKFIDQSVSGNDFKEAVDHVNNRDTSDVNSVKIFDVVEYLIHDPGKKSVTINVLELEPYNQFVLTKEVAASYFSNQYDVTIDKLDQMTIAQFNGSLEDINAKYDLIYIGTQNAGLNFSPYYQKQGKTIASSKLSGFGNNGVEFRYSANDLTEKKKGELLDFAQVGYPIIMEHSLYAKDANVVDNTSNMFGFITAANGCCLKDSSAIYNSYAHYQISNGLTLGKPNIVIEAEEPTYQGNSTGYIAGSNFDVSFHIKTTTTIPTSTKYKATVYWDSNGDGRYNGDDTVVDNSLNGIFSGNSSSYHISKPIPKNCSGALSWRLEVVKLNSDGSQTNIRNNYTNITAAKRMKNIKVLQIDGKNVDLSTNTNFKDQIKNLQDIKIEVTNVSLAQFTGLSTSTATPPWFNEITPYDETKPATDKLKGYDIVVLGFVDSSIIISNEYKALDNLKNFIANGKSVIFTSNTTSYDNRNNNWGSSVNQRFKNELSMKVDPNQFTYNLLNRMDSTGSINLKNLTLNNILSNYQTDKIQLANYGMITAYPYKINDSIFVASSSSHAYYQLDLESNINSQVSGWATLAGKPAFDESPKDIANNYYLYGNKNVFYSGISSESFTSTKTDEIKLFVNTIIAAAAANRAIKLTIENADSSDRNGNYSICSPVSDLSNTLVYTTQARTLQFIATDPSSPTQQLEMSFYTVLANGTREQLKRKAADGTTSLVNPKALDGTALVDGKVNSGTIYEFDFPYYYLNGNPGCKVIAIAKNSIGKEVEIEVSVLNRTLFDLD